MPVRYPAEWEQHTACWLAWPSHPNLWQDDYEAAIAQFVAFARALVAGGEKLEVLVADSRRKPFADAALAGLSARTHVIPFGDIWLRDTGPIFVEEGGKIVARLFSWNGWGEKYRLNHDDEVGGAIVERAAVQALRFPFVLEGGAVDSDGEGTCLTTRQCLLRGKRNANWDQRKAEEALRDSLGFEKVLWIEEGLLNDHTDGHIDTLARFTSAGNVVCMKPDGASDPNATVLKAIARDLATFTDAKGRKLTVHTVPSPGLVPDEDGEPMPASYMNFYIANKSVIVPTYGVPNDEAAVATLRPLFPGRTVVGVRAEAILSGGGAFHCISQQQPGVSK